MHRHAINVERRSADGVGFVRLRPRLADMDYWFTATSRRSAALPATSKTSSCSGSVENSGAKSRGGSPPRRSASGATIGTSATMLSLGRRVAERMPGLMRIISFGGARPRRS